MIMLYFGLVFVEREEMGDDVKIDMIVNFSDEDNKFLFLMVSNLGFSEEVCKRDV